MLEQLLVGFAGSLQPHNLFFVTLGVAVGILGGAMPGVSASTTVALLLPLTFGMPPDTSVILLAGAYVGAEYGGSITAIFINTPGTPPAVMTVLDGYACTKKGIPVKALGASLIPGTFGGLLANLALVLASVPLVEFALKFGPSEYFALALWGLMMVSSLGGGYWVKGVLAMTIGLLIAAVGTDAITGFPRFIFETPELLDGFELVPALVGLLALSEAFVVVEELGGYSAIPKKFNYDWPTWAEYKSVFPATLRGSVIGLIVGAIPAAGGTVASVLAYNIEKKISKHPEKFGTGVLEGVAAPESANNAVVGGSLIPTLTLGIPGSGTAAIMLGALALHGLVPGPELFSKSSYVVYNLFASQFLANIVMLLLGLVGVSWWARVVEVPKAVLASVIIALCFVGAYSVSGNIWNVGVTLAFGILGYWMRKLDFPPLPIVLALVGFVFLDWAT